MAQSGQLWLDRAAPRQTPTIRQPATRQPAIKRPAPRRQDFQGRSSSNIDRYSRDIPPLRQGREVSQGQGIDRQTLPPLQSAPVDQNYGRSPRGAGRQWQDQRRGPRLGPGQQGVAPIGSKQLNLPPHLWQNMSFEAFRGAMLRLDGRGGSPVLNNLVAQALLDPRSGPRNMDPEVHTLLKMVVLYRMGRIKDLSRFIRTLPQNARSLPVRIFEARAHLASGEIEKACGLATRFPVGDPSLSKDLLTEALMMTALCAAQKKDVQSMDMIGGIARDKGVKSAISYAVIDFLVSGARPRFKIPAKLGVRDYFFLRLLKSPTPRKILDMAEPALIYAIVHDHAASPNLRLDAAERAASKGQIDASGLAALYTKMAAIQGQGKRSDALTRALLYAGLSRTNDLQHRAKIIDTLLANARGRHLSGVIGPMLLPYLVQISPGPGLEWFALRAVEVALLAGDIQLAERWMLFVKQAGRRAYVAAEWLPLVNLVEKGSISDAEGHEMALRMAKARRLDGRALHRLTSILDALSFRVPIPLWNMAGKQPQSQKGALPATGVLSQLKKLSNGGQAGEILLMSLRAVGPHSADEMHLIALADIARSLKKAGFEKQAGMFGFNALYGIWPTGQRRQR